MGSFRPNSPSAPPTCANLLAPRGRLCSHARYGGGVADFRGKIPAPVPASFSPNFRQHHPLARICSLPACAYVRTRDVAKAMERDKTEISPYPAIKKSRRYIESSALKVRISISEKARFFVLRDYFSASSSTKPARTTFCGTLAQVRGGLQRRTRSPPLLTFGTFGHAKVRPLSPAGMKQKTNNPSVTLRAPPPFTQGRLTDWRLSRQL